MAALPALGTPEDSAGATGSFGVVQYQGEPLASQGASIPNLSGSWDVEETVTLTTTVNGESDTTTESGSDTVTVFQTGSAIYYYKTLNDPDTGAPISVLRSGAISGNTVTFSGVAALPLAGATYSTNSMVFVGTLSADGKTITGTSTVNVAVSYAGYTGTITGSGAETFTLVEPLDSVPATMLTPAVEVRLRLHRSPLLGMGVLGPPNTPSGSAMRRTPMTCMPGWKEPA